MPKPRPLSRPDAARALMQERTEFARQAEVYAADLDDMMDRLMESGQLTPEDMVRLIRVQRWLLRRMGGLGIHEATMVLRAHFPDLTTVPPWETGG